MIELADEPQLDDVVSALSAGDAFAFGSPMYRASYAAPFKALLDQTPRGMHGEQLAPLTGKAAVTVATAASDHHFLAPQAMRDILVDFFAVHVVSPGLYVPAAGFASPHQLTDEFAARARTQALALVELAGAIATSTALRQVTPNA
jgi:NAD(P)H-dependent FMN reductase